MIRRLFFSMLAVGTAIVILLLLPMKSASAQQAEAYEKAFKTRYPDIAAPMWIRKGNGTYEATFKLKGAFASSFYTADGQWLFDKTPVDSMQVPVAVKNAVVQKYKDGKIAFAEKLLTADSTVQYQLSIKQGAKRTDALYDENGNLLK